MQSEIGEMGKCCVDGQDTHNYSTTPTCVDISVDQLSSALRDNVRSCIFLEGLMFIYAHRNPENFLTIIQHVILLYSQNIHFIDRVDF